MTDKLYRPCVGVCLFNQDGQVFVGERIDTPGAWQMPQGGIDKGEDILPAALRELKEEIGTDQAELIAVMPETLRYDIPAKILERLHKEWSVPYIGQEQHWVALRFTGHDQDIDLEADDRPEFSQWQWMEINKTLDYIVPFKRDLYQEVIKSFAQYAT